MAVSVPSQRGGRLQPSGLVRPRRSFGHPALLFVLRRVGAGIATLVVASMLIYGAIMLLPGNVAQVVLGKNATPERLAQVDSQLHLNAPFFTRYWDWLTGIVQGHLGNSMAALAQGTTLPVWQAIGTPLRNSLILAGITIAIFVPICLLLGTVAALRAGKESDHIISLGSLAIGSMPEFLIGTLLIAIFFTKLGLFPGVSTISSGQTPFSHPNELVLPVLTLLCVSVAFGVRLLRASIIDVLREDYVAMARLNGVRERRVVWRYALRNALAPSVQVVAQMVQYLVGGIIITETVFSYPGIGTQLVQAVQVRDPQVVSVVAMLLATVYVGVNIIADLTVVFVVPKLRTSL